MSILGLDIGTTNIKSVLFNNQGKILHRNFRKNSIENDGCRFEVNVMDLWDNIKSLILENSVNSGNDPVKSMCFTSSSGEIIFPIDKSGNPLANAFTSYDNRGSEYFNKINELIGGDEFYRITRFPSKNTIGAIHRLLWFKEHKKDVYRDCWKFVDYNQFFNYKLGFEAKTDYSSSSNGLYDYETHSLSCFILDKMKINMKKLDGAVPSGIIIGKINQRLAEELHLCPDVSLVSGGLDQACAALGSGVYKEGQASLGLGTVICLIAPKNSLALDNLSLKLNIHFVRHVYNDLPLVSLWTWNGCSVIGWLKDNFRTVLEEKNQVSGDFYDVLEKGIKNSRRNIYFLPHLSGSNFPFYNENSRGTFLGLDLNTDINDIASGLLNGLSCEIKEKVDIMGKSGLRLNKIFVTGGGSKFDFWVKTISGFCNLPLVTLKNEECGCTGCAIISSLATGIYSSIEEAVSVFVKEKKTFEPEKNDFYKQYFHKFSQIYGKVSKFYKI
jgi:xylulokinase